ncbi:MAG TPA: HAMP domain-containing sensor histidine kinase [Streptosporangiaceae bacterium]|nr:HAMP domain-containing sensor histidine kinase [Streptosporangiaceae bacterium]
MTLDTEHQLAVQIEALERAMPDRLADISHELRTPLTTIAGFVELLRDQDAGPLTPEQQRMLATVDRNTAKLWQVIENILTLAKIESHAFKTTRCPVNLAPLTAQAVAAVQSHAAAKGLTVTAECGAGSVTVRGDPTQLDRLITSLLFNAVGFTPPAGRVLARCDSDGIAALLSVTSTSASGEVQQPASPLPPPPPGDEADPGPGLGLALCRTIVANHGGGLTLTSQKRRGTTVTVRIPLAGAHSADPEPDDDAMGCVA